MKALENHSFCGCGRKKKKVKVTKEYRERKEKEVPKISLGKIIH